MNERSIFIDALEIAAPDERVGFVNRVCGNDSALRERVQHLLRTFEQASGFMHIPAADLLSTTDQPPQLEQPGTVIGPYKLLEQIGEGGFGVVFMAEQNEPVRRKVALKIVKPGMDSRHVIARFEAERKALAIMYHPNIAREFDG